MPKLEGQARVEASELPLQELIQIFEDPSAAADISQQLVEQQFEEDIARTKLVSIQSGKRPTDSNGEDDEGAKVIQTLLDKVFDLEHLIQQYTLKKTAVPRHHYKYRLLLQCWKIKVRRQLWIGYKDLETIGKRHWDVKALTTKFISGRWKRYNITSGPSHK